MKFEAPARSNCMKQILGRSGGRKPKPETSANVQIRKRKGRVLKTLGFPIYFVFRYSSFGLSMYFFPHPIIPALTHS